MKKLTKGFTLIELLVVIAIIGILSSVVLASLNSARQKSRDARRISDVKQIQLALELYFDSNGEYPDDIAALETAGYLAQEPVEPSGNNYVYDNYDDEARGTCLVADAGSCAFYHLGVALEQPGHAALQGDLDTDSAVDAGPDGLSTLADCAEEAGVVEADDLCYDVTP